MTWNEPRDIRDCPTCGGTRQDAPDLGLREALRAVLWALDGLGPMSIATAKSNLRAALRAAAPSPEPES
jgi:hypothetical protein